MLSPSTSPCHPSRSASPIRAMRLSRISAMRGRWAGSGQSIGQRMQACSWMQGVANARPHSPAETLRRSKWPRNCSHSSSVGVRYSSVGRRARRRARNARWLLDHLVGVDGLVAEGDVDVAVPGDDLGDVRGQPGQDRVGDEYPPEIVGGEDQRLPGRVGQPGPGERGVEHVAHGAGGDLPGLGAAAPLEQQRGRWLPEVLVAVVAGGQRDLPVRLLQPGDDRGQHVGEVG